MRVSWRNEARYAGIHTENFTRRVTWLYQYLVGSGPTYQWDMSCGLWSVQCAHRNCIQSSGPQATSYYTVYPFLLVKWKRYSIWSSLLHAKMDVSTTKMCLDTSIWERLRLYCVSQKKVIWIGGSIKRCQKNLQTNMDVSNCVLNQCVKYIYISTM